MKQFIERNFDSIMVVIFHVLAVLAIGASLTNYPLIADVSMKALFPFTIASVAFYISIIHVFKFNVKHVPAGY